MNLEAYYMSVPQEDVDRWRQAGRYDILEWVVSIPIGGDEFIHDIWISPTTGKDVRRCPWLRKLPKQNKYICRIQGLKPTVCRVFPLSRKHAEECGCAGFDEP
jgi:Fe-S-cluster containining protein